ncbi:hypothetical protein CDN99_15145 [Roseateles aquatilis]|uniref:DUF3592 domain-containing protein n=1 Tax=Roseateles aquatilis TaxID=431061 RepID=A0A246J8F2_9BURK|nr:DUF3592 domain-containing protein [Roseateles aquatilis]OWQ88812.1 hypothetical protein CDN99_15145 [Roseateles aquatilis]
MPALLNDSRRPARVASAVFLAGALVCLTFLAWYGSEWMHAQASRDWPRTPALVVDTTIVDGQGKNRGKQYLEVHYRYAVEDRSYVGSRLAFGSRWSGDPASLAALASRLKPGMPVRYDPATPERAVLLPGELAPGTSRVRPLGFGFVGCLVMAVVVLRWRGSSTRLGSRATQRQ